MGRKYNARQTKTACVILVINLSKAFDTLDHSIILEKLNHYGIRGIANNLLGRYLKGRFQYTNFDGKIQKSFQSFLEFLRDPFSKANKVLENVHDYMKYSLLHINMEKCCFMHFQPKAFSVSDNCSRTVPFVGNIHVSKAIYINGQKLKEVRNTKVLGVILDNELDWSCHIHE